MYKIAALCLALFATIYSAEVSALSVDDCVLDLVFVVDSSGSIGSPNWGTMMTFLNSITSDLTIGPDNVHVGLVVFGTDAQVTFDLDEGSDATVVSPMIMGAAYLDSGSTDIAAGVEEARTMVFQGIGDRPGVPNVMVVISDGLSDENAANNQASLAKADNINIITIGIGNNVDEQLLKDMSSLNEVFTVDDFDALDLIAGPVAQAACDMSGGTCYCRDCPKWQKLTYDTFIGGLDQFFNVKIVDTQGELPPQKAEDGLRLSGEKVFLGEATPYVIDTKKQDDGDRQYICVKSVTFDTSCSDQAEVRLMIGKAVIYWTTQLQGSQAWLTTTATFGPCLADRIKIRIWESQYPGCEPQPLTAIRHVGVTFCEVP
jgi:uncharacterized protein YegL